MGKNSIKGTKLPIIKKYWQFTPELFSEKYEINYLSLLSPVNMFLLRRRKKALEIAGNIKGQKILDVGCGSGVFMMEFIKRGATVIGIDYSQKMLDLAKKEFQKYKIPKNKYKLIKADAKKLPFKDNSFDLILATGLTDYMTDQDDKKFIHEAARVLKKNGKLIVSFPIDKSPFSFIRSGIGLEIRQKFFKLPPIHNDFSIEKINDYLEKAGMKVKQSHKIFSTMWLILAQFKKT